jgi:hypothetical protein
MRLLTDDKVIENFISVHGDRYDYSLVKYKNAKTKIIIICKIHGEFEQLPSSHYNRKSNCPMCGKIETSKYTLRDQKSIIKDFIKLHKNIYDYSLVKYVNMNTNIDILCKIHGKFKQLPLNHLHSKSGCPICKQSKGELEVLNVLQTFNLNIECQKRFNDCKNIRTLPFDFYIKNLNICIEYDGIQHIQASSFFGGIRAFKQRKINDEIKNKFCLDNNIKLIRISHKDDIEKILSIEIGKYDEY